MSPKNKKTTENDISELINVLLTSQTEQKSIQICETISHKPTALLSLTAEVRRKIVDLASLIVQLSNKLMRSEKASCDEQEGLLYSLISSIAMLDMTVRTSILERRDKCFYEKEKQLVANSFIHISVPSNAIVRVIVPPLIGRQFKGSYNIYWKLKEALSQFEIGHPFEVPHGEKLVLIYKRYSRNLTAVHTCDNDNWEMKRATNAISEALNYSDNAEHFSMLYTTVKSSTDCVEATVIKQKDLVLFLDYLTDEHPMQDIFSGPK